MSLRGPFADLIVKGHGGGNQHGRRRDGQAVEIAGVHGALLHVEAGQPEGPADHKEEGRHPAELVVRAFRAQR